MPTLDQSRQRAKDERLQPRKISQDAYICRNPVKRTTYNLTRSKADNNSWNCDCPYMTLGSSRGSYCKHIVLIIDIERTCAFIPITKGGKIVAYGIVDKQDFDKVNGYKWYLYNRKVTDTVYAFRCEGPAHKRKSIYLHRQILNITDKTKVDHINIEGLDCRRSNLRFATSSQNASNWHHVKFKGKYRGVFKKGSKFIAEFNHLTVRHRIGAFDTELEAAKAYDSAVEQYHKEFAITNLEKSVG